MITVFSNRIEILSRGTLAPEQTIEGFFLGESIPVNRKLSDLFLQLHISERSGRGVPKITEMYGRDAFEFRENSIVVTLPFTILQDSLVDKPVDKKPKMNEQMEKVLLEIRNNPNITQPQLVKIMNIGKSMIQRYISNLKKMGYIERIGSNKSGY